MTSIIDKIIDICKNTYANNYNDILLKNLMDDYIQRWTIMIDSNVPDNIKNSLRNEGTALFELLQVYKKQKEILEELNLQKQ
jgi:hypothetical protein